MTDDVAQRGLMLFGLCMQLISSLAEVRVLLKAILWRYCVNGEYALEYGALLE
jgi:hypothetical protein